MSVTYAYDAAGRMSSRTWARGVVTNYGYDPATGQLLSTTYSDGTPAVTYTYDRRARIATVVDGVGSRTMSYTAYDQLSNEALTLTGFGTGSIAYTHDVYGRRTQSSPMMQPTGSTAFGQGVNYAYAAGTGLLSSVSGPATFTYTYLANSGLPASIGGSDTKELTWAAHRDDLVSYDNRYSGGSFSAHRFEYTRDEISRIVIETQYKEDSLFSGIPFSYNPRSELTSGPGSVVSYDEQGNRVTGNGAAYQANALNQYTAVGGSAWTHDADGNLLSNGTQTNVYDAENRLVQVTKGSMVYSFAYDYRHRLVKHSRSWQGSSSPPDTSWRLYDGDRAVLRYDYEGGYTRTAQYLWGRDLAGRHASGDGTGGLLVVWSNGIGYLPHYDGRGNIWGFSGGYSRSLSAFGEVAFYPSGLPPTMPIGLLSYAHGTKEYFSDLGLYNYGRRFYDPKTGRFIGRDPIQENGGLNLYAFVRNNPANLWDYLGMIEVYYKDKKIDSSKLLDGVADLDDGSDEDEDKASEFLTAWELENLKKYQDAGLELSYGDIGMLELLDEFANAPNKAAENSRLGWRSNLGGAFLSECDLQVLDYQLTYPVGTNLEAVSKEIHGKLADFSLFNPNPLSRVSSLGENVLLFQSDKPPAFRPIRLETFPDALSVIGTTQFGHFLIGTRTWQVLPGGENSLIVRTWGLEQAADPVIHAVYSTNTDYFRNLQSEIWRDYFNNVAAQQNAAHRATVTNINEVQRKVPCTPGGS